MKTRLLLASLPARVFARAIILPSLAMLIAGCSDETSESRVDTSLPELSVSATSAPEPVAVQADPETVSDENEIELKSRFDEFSQYQKSLKTRFGDLAYNLRDASIEGKDHKLLRTKMSRAGYLLKLPKGIAAFSSVDDVEKERKRLKEAEILMNEVKILAGLAQEK